MRKIATANSLPRHSALSRLLQFARRAMETALVGAPLALAPVVAIAETATYTPVTTTVNGLPMTIFTKPTDDGGALRIASAGQFLWFGEHSTAKIVKFSQTGAAKLFTITSPGAVPLAITRGPDRNVWFTVWNQALIGRILPTGVIDLFATGTAQTNSNDILSGPDGNLWFATDFMGLGRTTTAGVTQFFNTNTNSSQPTGLAVGPDKNIWFVQCCQNSPEVGRMSTSGTNVTEFDVGFAGFSNSFGIASSHSRIWFCDTQRRRIGRINVDGTGLKYFATGLTGDPISIINGPDGNLYFGEVQGQIGRISAVGAITEYPIPGDAGTNNFPVLGLVVGSDKNIWFANNAHAQIGKLQIQALAAADVQMSDGE